MPPSPERTRYTGRRKPFGGSTLQAIRPTRRSFVVAAEVPGLLLGAVRGNATSLRRLLGARRTGRWGAGLCALGLLLAAPSIDAAAAWIGLHVVLALYVVIPRGGAIGLSVRQELCLSLWAAAPLLVVLAGLRAIWPDSWLPAVGAGLLGHLLVWVGVRRSLA